MFARSSRIITFILSFYVRLKLNNKVGKLNNNNRETDQPGMHLLSALKQDYLLAIILFSAENKKDPNK